MTVTEQISPEVEYYSTPGLSQSAMKDLAVSPLRYWYRNVNPNRPIDEPTPSQLFGLALHCAVLEPEKFDTRYSCAVAQDDFPDALDTMEDLRDWLNDRGVKPKGKRKQDLIDQCLSVSPDVPIWQTIQDAHASANDGKAILSKEMWANVVGAANALRSQPALEPILAEGRAEVPYFAKDPDTGVLLKGKLDWVTSYCTVDVKTFSQQRGKSIDRSIADAVFHEGYYRQAYFYSLLRKLQPQPEKAVFILAFVESEPPFEVRLRELRPKTFECVSLLWERARLETRSLIDTYSRYQKRYGSSPWLDEQEITELTDEQIPQLAYA